MLLWFAGMSFVGVWTIFRSPALDYRLVMLGAVLPLVELPFGTGILHTLAAPVIVLCAVMAATTHRRLLRRRWLGLPIGMFVHLVLDGTVARPALFWWPLGGSAFGRALPEQSLGRWLLVFEFVGAGALMWAVGRFQLDRADPRSLFLRTGQLERDLTRSEDPPTC